MKQSSLWIVLMAVVGIPIAAALGRSQDPDLAQIMQRKLDHAHAILEALITEDYETLEDSAKALQSLSEEAGWFVLQTPEYTQWSTAFRHAAREIEVSAKNRNLHGAALGYVDMTLKCVQCHEHLRGSAMASVFSPTVGQSAQLERLTWQEALSPQTR